jgi:hypothetical protein
MDSPGGLTNLIQVFSGMSVRLDHLEMRRGEESATVVVRYRTDPTTAKHVQRKLSRLIEVLSIAVEPDT